MPGLINAHDHLEFNLYARLGRGPYPNAGAWARDVYLPNESPVQEQLRIPKGIRLIWGGLKNLLSGVTTVCHHNPRELAVFDRNFPVRVVKAVRLGAFARIQSAVGEDVPRNSSRLALHHSSRRRFRSSGEAGDISTRRIGCARLPHGAGARDWARSSGAASGEGSARVHCVVPELEPVSLRSHFKRWRLFERDSYCAGE